MLCGTILDPSMMELMQMTKDSNPQAAPSPQRFTIIDLLKLYWRSDQRFIASVFFGFVMLMTIGLVGLDVIFNFWYNAFYDGLQAYDKRTTIRLLMYFFGLAGIYIVIAVYRYYISQLLQLRWRKWLTNNFIQRWLTDRRYYLIENFDESTDNPDQRIQEDVGGIVANSLSLITGIVSAVTTFFAFIFVLWRLSGVVTLSLGKLGTYHLHGYLVWVGLLYCGIGTWLTFKIGKPLIALNFEQQKREATFRYAAIDLRTHAEHVALYRGEHHQASILHNLFNRVLDNWYAIVLRQKILLWFTAGFNQIAVVLPLMVALPNYFGKVFLLGGLIQSLQAFGRVQDALSYLVNSYTSIAEWRAIGQRLTSFVNHMETVDAKAKHENKLTLNEDSNNQISAKKVMIKNPREGVLLKGINQEFKGGHSYVIKGESGIGKSTFVRTIAGIWPYASGEISLPANKNIMYLPQKAYMPIGTLAEAILFPDKHDPALENQLPDVMRACHLEDFIPRLNETAYWSEQLSPGEQQRIAFARVLLHKPDWVFLDESTSMLDVANEKRMYELMKTHLPNCTVVSVGHHPGIDAYHEHVVDMTQYEGMHH